MTPVLAIDSSGKTASVCIMQGTDVLFEKTLDQGLTHSETLMPLVATALENCNLLPKDIGCYAVTAGPGSFTGLRIGLALVKGLALPFATPVVPVSTLEALAADVCSFQNIPEGILITALDARRNEVYWAAFNLGQNCKRLLADTAGPATSIPMEIDIADKPVYLTGDGAALCLSLLQEQYPGKFQVLEKGISLSRGAAMASLGKTATHASSLAPAYLRLSQAERNRLFPQNK